MSISPHIGLAGVYELKQPWQVSLTKTYTCIALRSFADIYEDGSDVYTEFYADKGIDRDVFEVDARNKVLIVTLTNDENDFVYVPTSYILKMPEMGDVKYSRRIVSIDLNALPDYLNLDLLVERLGTNVADVIGVIPDIKEHKMPSTGVVTPQQHRDFEEARASKVQLTGTDYMRYLNEKKRADELYDRLKLLEQMAIEKGIL